MMVVLACGQAVGDIDDGGTGVEFVGVGLVGVETVGAGVRWHCRLAGEH